MKRFILLCFLGCLPVMGMAATPMEEAASQVHHLATEAFRIANDLETPLAERREYFNRLMEDGIDINRVSRRVAGRYWRQATAEERARIPRLIKRTMNNFFLKALADRPAPLLTVKRVAPIQSPRYEAFRVITNVAVEGLPNLKIEWRLVRANNGNFKLFDVAVEDISIVSTVRARFASAIQAANGTIKAGLDALEREFAGPPPEEDATVT